MEKMLKNLFKINKIKTTSQKNSIFVRFFKILLEENRRINLTRIIEKKEVAKKHFLDSVMSEKFIPQNAVVIDVGSGAGFPSIPLKILREDLSFTMVDSVLKKTKFLNKTIQELKLKNIFAIHSRSEDLAQKNEFRENFDVCVSRAVAELNVLCEYCLPFLKEGGILIAYKSQNIEREMEKAKKAIHILGGKIQQVYFYKLDDSEKENCLVIIKKTGRTPQKYPRRKNKARTNPIL